MTHYRAQPDDDAVLIVLCAVRDGQFGKSTLNEVIDLWVSGQIGRTDSIPGAVPVADVEQLLSDTSGVVVGEMRKRLRALGAVTR
jgi:hypothetical protein